MPFMEIKNIPGMIWVPEEETNKKYKCEDCFACQMCSDERCSLCRKSRSGKNCCSKNPPN
jgi:hypothetical protein